MKTLFITFIFIAFSTSLLPQTKRNSTHSQKRFAHLGFTLRHQLEQKQTLSKAVQEKDLAAVKALLASGADPNVGDQTGTPLAWAARLNLTDIVKLLLDSGANVNARDSDDRSILISAAEWPFGEQNRSYVPTIKALLDKGADVSIRDKFNMTALLYAAYYRDADVVRLLIDSRSDINAKANGGQTALMRAIAARKKDTVALLLDRGANITAKDDNGSTRNGISGKRG